MLRRSKLALAALTLALSLAAASGPPSPALAYLFSHRDVPLSEAIAQTSVIVRATYLRSQRSSTDGLDVEREFRVDRTLFVRDVHPPIAAPPPRSSLRVRDRAYFEAQANALAEREGRPVRSLELPRWRGGVATLRRQTEYCLLLERVATAGGVEWAFAVDRGVARAPCARVLRAARE